MFTDRRTPILVLMGLCLLVALQPIALTASNYITITPNVYFKESLTYGEMEFDANARTTQISFNDGFTYFSNLRYVSASTGYAYSSIGFRITNNGNITVTEIEEDTLGLTLNANTGENTVTKLWLPSTRIPNTVSGVDSWTMWINTLTLFHEHDSPTDVLVAWSETHDLIGVEYEGDLLDALTGDLTGGIVGIYTDVMGNVFWAFLVMIFMAPLYNRIGILPIGLMGLFSWFTLVVVVPAVGLNIMYAILLIVGAGTLVVLFFSRRRQYG